MISNVLKERYNLVYLILFLESFGEDVNVVDKYCWEMVSIFLRCFDVFFEKRWYEIVKSMEIMIFLVVNFCGDRNLSFLMECWCVVVVIIVLLLFIFVRLVDLIWKVLFLVVMMDGELIEGFVGKMWLWCFVFWEIRCRVVREDILVRIFGWYSVRGVMKLFMRMDIFMILYCMGRMILR